MGGGVLRSLGARCVCASCVRGSDGRIRKTCKKKKNEPMAGRWWGHGRSSCRERKRLASSSQRSCRTVRHHCSWPMLVGAVFCASIAAADGMRAWELGGGSVCDWQLGPGAVGGQGGWRLSGTSSRDLLHRYAAAHLLSCHALIHCASLKMCGHSLARSFPPFMARSAVASACTDAAVATPHPLWRKAGAVQESVAAVLTKLEAGVVSGVVQVHFSCRLFLLCVRVHMLVQEREHASLHKS